MKKKEKKDWLEKGLALLESEGFQKITIDSMCTILSVTKGSFYHHFRSIDGYIEALMQYWLEKNTVDFISATESVVAIEEKYIRLNDLAVSASQKAEQVIRAWSFSNETVKKYVQQADQMRLSYLAGLNLQAGMATKEATDYATIEYGTLIGIQQLCPDISEEAMKQLYALFVGKLTLKK